MKLYTYLYLAAFIAPALIATPAAAEKGGNGHGNGNGKKNYAHERSYNGDDYRHSYYRDNDRVVVIIDSERDYIRDYIRTDYRRHCPPGLAKKNNGCQPPGQAKKYRVGYPLPDDVVYVPVPRDLLVHLSPVPAGYQYVKVDKDVLLIAEASKKVIDAVTLLSAVGN
jgi:hypothetical protein